MPGQVIASTLRPFTARLRALGKDPAPIFARLKIADPDREGRTWITRAEVRAFLEAAAIEANDPDLGLNVALTRPRGTYGVVEFGTRSAPDLRRAFEFTLRFSPLFKEGLESFFEDDGTEARYGFSAPDDPLGTGRHAHEFKLFAALLIIRETVDPGLDPKRIWFSHPKPADISAHLKLARKAELRFGQSECGLAWESIDLLRPMRSADPALFSFLEKQAGRLVASPETPFVADVRERLRKLLGKEAPDMNVVAKQLHMSGRTLQRRLEAEGLNFQALLDQLRQQMARRLVGQSDLSTEAIAQQLGYANLTAFLRAFKRWAGTSPTEYRRRARGGEQASEG